jgi:hypothetical protein
LKARLGAFFDDQGGLMTETCLYCGKELQKPRKLKDFCSYSNRGKHVVNALDGAEYQSGLSGSKNTKRNKALRTLQKQSRGDFTFHRINSVTYRTDRPCKRGVGWLMEVVSPGGARQRWVARVGNHASEQLPLGEAKKAAVALLRERGKTEPRDWIGELNQAAADEVDRVARQKARRQAPVEVMGGGKQLPARMELVLGFLKPHEIIGNILEADWLSDR